MASSGLEQEALKSKWKGESNRITGGLTRGGRMVKRISPSVAISSRSSRCTPRTPMSGLLPHHLHLHHTTTSAAASIIVVCRLLA